jgi:hypothetical protein
MIHSLVPHALELGPARCKSAFPHSTATRSGPQTELFSVRSRQGGALPECCSATARLPRPAASSRRTAWPARSSRSRSGRGRSTSPARRRPRVTTFPTSKTPSDATSPRKADSVRHTVTIWMKWPLLRHLTASRQNHVRETFCLLGATKACNDTQAPTWQVTQ